MTLLGSAGQGAVPNAKVHVSFALELEHLETTAIIG